MAAKIANADFLNVSPDASPATLPIWQTMADSAGNLYRFRRDGRLLLRYPTA
jgi:hypothetical protein